MKFLRSLSFSLSLALMSAVLAVSVSAAGQTPNPVISAPSAIVIDFDTGETLFERNANERRVPASMTKSLTAFIAYEEMAAGRLSFDTQVQVSNYAASVSSSYTIQGFRFPLAAGSYISVEDLLHLMMLPSSNGAFVVIAEHISGSESAFAERMNETAYAIGMTLAEFNNPHGSIPNYSNAYSMAILAKVFIERYPDILRITSTTSFSFNGTTLNLTNQLVREGSYHYAGADGFKTGTINEAWCCLTSTAMRNGRRIIAVVMGTSNNDQRFGDSRTLLNYGFAEAAARDAIRATMGISVILDGVELEFDVAPRIIDNRVMVPMRAIFEAMDAEVIWEAEGRRILATTSDGDLITLVIGSSIITRNGVDHPIDAPARIVGNRTLVPLRFVAEALDKNVDYVEDTRSVFITSAAE